MDTEPENTPGSSIVPKTGVGAKLRAARERAGLSLTDVAGHLKFAPRQIEALEADDFANLPELPFVRGFVRNYAKLLQIDSVPLLDALPSVPTKTVDVLLEMRSNNVPLPGVYAARKYNIVWLAGGLVIALVLAVFVWLGNSTNAVPRTKIVELPLPVSPIPVAQTTAATALSKAKASPAGVSSVSANLGPLIHMVFAEDAWVEVMDNDSVMLMAQLNPAGSERKLGSTNPPFTVKIGNADKVQLYYKGRQVDLTPHNRAGVARLTLE